MSSAEPEDDDEGWVAWMSSAAQECDNEGAERLDDDAALCEGATAHECERRQETEPGLEAPAWLYAQRRRPRPGRPVNSGQG
ncbi:CMP N-glycosidase [Sesbania bispinosa]|nr:CMP N-glycosidase [Sesbania bispinosa]